MCCITDNLKVMVLTKVVIMMLMLAMMMMMTMFIAQYGNDDDAHDHDVQYGNEPQDLV